LDSSNVEAVAAKFGLTTDFVNVLEHYKGIQGNVRLPSDAGLVDKYTDQILSELERPPSKPLHESNVNVLSAEFVESLIQEHINQKTGVFAIANRHGISGHKLQSWVEKYKRGESVQSIVQGRTSKIL
jgi:hypothetical protein